MYAIYLYSLKSKDQMHSNYYGWWSGKDYIFQGSRYPVCDSFLTDRVKLYKSKKIAENSAEKCIDKYGYVDDAKVRKV